MKKIYLIFFFLFFSLETNATADYNKYEIKEGNENAKVKIFVFESLTCPHCADFHKNIYPSLKTDFIDKGLVQIYFKNFPLDLAGLNAAKITHCLNNDKRLIFFAISNADSKTLGIIASYPNSFLSSAHRRIIKLLINKKSSIFSITESESSLVSM